MRAPCFIHLVDKGITGKFFYDSALPFKISKVDGTLTDLAQTTAITEVWNLIHDLDAPSDWAYLDNGDGVDPVGYNAGFVLNLLDTGDKLAIDTSKDNGLSDWSGDMSYFDFDHLNDSPLRSWRIQAVQSVPEPASLGLLGLGLFAGVFARRRTDRRA